VIPLLLIPIPLGIVRSTGESYSFDSSENGPGVDFAYFFSGVFITAAVFIPAALLNTSMVRLPHLLLKLGDADKMTKPVG